MSKDPYYLEISRRLRKSILSHEVSIGDKILSEQALAEKYSVSRMTARQAVTELVNEGLVERRRGSGVFVVNNKISRSPTSLVGFYKDMEARGLNPGSEVLCQSTRHPTPEEMERLQLGKFEEVLYIERVRSVDGVKVAFQQLTVPIARVPELVDIDLGRESFYGWLEGHGLPITAGHQRIEALVDKRIAGLLEAEPQTPLLKVARRSFLHDGEAIEHLITYYHGERHAFEMELR